MKYDPFDPFEAWQNFQTDGGKKLLKEELDVSKLHEPEDFVREVGEFIQETSAHIKALQDFSHHHEVPRTNPKFGQALDAVAAALDRLKRESASLKIPPNPAEQSAPGKTFKKI